MLAAEPNMKHGCDQPESSRSSGPSVTGDSVDAPSATIDSTTAEVAEEEDAGTDMTIAKSGATILGRTVGRANLARALGGGSLARSAHRAMSACLHCRHRQEGTKTTTRTRGLGASRSLEPLPASWAAHRP